MNYLAALKGAADIVLLGMVDRAMWEGLLDGVIAILALIVRVLILIMFPLSVPVLAWLIVIDERKTAIHVAEIRERLRRDIHRNGRAYD